MGTMLDTLRERLEDARSRLVLASQEYQAAGAKLQQVQTECNIWTAAVTLETREEEKRLAKASEDQIPMDLPDFMGAPNSENLSPPETHPEAAASPAVVNKTQKVRDILAEHAAGIAPAEIWMEVKDYVSSRAYLYAILKRLRDNDEVSIRRGRYSLKPKPVQMNIEEAGRVVVQ